MSTYRRWHVGRVFFFTVVTQQRREILTDEVARPILRNAIQSVREEHPFTMVATVLLPDHLHMIWELPTQDTDYSRRWQKIKSRFTRNWLKQGGTNSPRSESRLKRGEEGIWQRRFFEHTCRDDSDLKRCVDYIHVNPLKHGLVNAIRDWPWSSFHRYVELGEYSLDWGSADHWYGDEFVNFE